VASETVEARRSKRRTVSARISIVLDSVIALFCEKFAKKQKKNCESFLKTRIKHDLKVYLAGNFALDILLPYFD
jgi:hypothetical protein